MALRTEIYIPTLGRIGMNKQVTLRKFLDCSSHKPWIVCPRSEESSHRAYYPKVKSCIAKGIGPTRQWILQASGADIVIMADDDMRFQNRVSTKSTELEQCMELDPLIELIKKYVGQGFIHGGIGPRQGNNRKIVDGRRVVLDGKHLYTDCERVNNFHWLYRSKIMPLGVRFDQLPVMEDFHFTLSLLTMGYPNRVIHSYVWNQGFSGMEGGCSLYRTPAVQEQGAEGLKLAFPDFVRVVTKVSKDTSPSWREFKERKDVVVQWLKAYKSSQKE